MKSYDHKKIEQKWRDKWAAEKIYQVPDTAAGKENFYTLVEFAYPSGNLHIGHWYAFAIPDIFARFERMRGKNVLYPIGFDSFGLPAENAAIKRGLDPREWTYSNIEYMREQLKSMGASFDWSREIITSDPEYYRFTQWMFARFFEKGLAYRAETTVNWCPSCQTILANEQVITGRCERCDTEVEKRQELAWSLAITKYADELLGGLNDLDWPEEIKEQQRNWIGKSTGAEIDFPLKTKPEHFVVLPGFKSGPDQDFHPWLQAELKARGHKVDVLSLPHADNPDIEEQIEYVLENVKLTADTVLIGHSLGAVVAMKVLERLPHAIKRTILVAPYLDTEFADQKKRGYENTFNWQFDSSKIKAHAGELTILEPQNDTSVSTEQYDRVRQTFGDPATKWVKFTAQVPHAKGETEPQVLRSALPHITVFTTRPDTIFGATYLVLAPESKLVGGLQDQISNWSEVVNYIEATQKKTDIERTAEGKEKTGVELKGVKTINPATGEEVPIFIADYVLVQYGTGAIMAVPAHDERDHEFAEKFNLPIKEVTMPSIVDHVNPPQLEKPTKVRQNVHAIVYDPKTKKYLTLRSEEFQWNTVVIGGIEEGEDAVAAAFREVEEETGYVDLQFKRVLGSPVRAAYFAKHKDENRVAIATAVYLELTSDKKAALAPEEEGKNEIVWREAAEFIPGVMVNSELPIWLERLKSQSDLVYTGEGVLVGSGEFDGLSTAEAKEKITARFGRPKITYKMRDWSIGRQRYWGTPIPIVYDPDGQAHVVPDEHLPWLLPDDVDHTPSGEAPLARSTELKERTEKIFGPGWTPAVETMDTFVDSCWYYLRYLDPHNAESFSALDKQKLWMPVDQYFGGAEHTTMHLLYSRFFYKALADLGAVTEREPYRHRLNRGLIMGPDGQKMSKSRGNVVDPDEQVAQVGADAVRILLAFLGPYGQAGSYPMNLGGIAGMRRFLERVWSLADELVDTESAPEVVQKLHQTIRKVSVDIEGFKFNTAISAMMELVNTIQKVGVVARTDYAIFLRILAPFAPYLTEEIWRDVLGQQNSIHLESWPQHDEAKSQQNVVTYAIQVNGKTRVTLEMAIGATETEVVRAAQELPQLEKWLVEGEIQRTIFVPNRLVNFVL